MFAGCPFECGGAADKSVYLARPWRDFGKCDFIDCTLGSHISPLLYDKWNDTYRDHTARFADGGLKSDSPLAPVAWSRRLSDDERAAIGRDTDSALELWRAHAEKYR